VVETRKTALWTPFRHVSGAVRHGKGATVAVSGVTVAVRSAVRHGKGVMPDEGEGTCRRDARTTTATGAAAIVGGNLADFISAYFVTSPAADADGSGAVDPDDLADFISRYFSADPCG